MTPAWIENLQAVLEDTPTTRSALEYVQNTQTFLPFQERASNTFDDNSQSNSITNIWMKGLQAALDDPQATSNEFLHSHDADGNTLLHTALREKAPPDIIQFLLDAGISPHQRNNAEVSPSDKAEQMVREKLEVLQEESDRGRMSWLTNWQIKMEWQNWFKMRDNRKENIVDHSSPSSCPPSTKYSLDDNGRVICTPQNSRFYEEHIYILLITAARKSEEDHI